MSQFPHRAKALFDKVFPERQIYHRSGGTVRYISLKPSHQAMMALAGIGIAGWCAYATINVALSGQFQSAQDTEVQRMEAKYKRWLAEARAREHAAEAQLRERTTQFESATNEFERRHETLKMLLDYAGGSSITASARPIERDGAGLLAQVSIDEAEPRQSRAWEEPQYRVQAVGFRARVERLKAEQTAFLSSAEEGAVNRAEQIRSVLRMTDISVARLVGEDGDAAMGGPLVPLDLAGVLETGEVDPAFQRRVQQVAARIEEARRLEGVASSTPLAPPVGVDYRFTSGYGPRFDPFHGRTAMHSGLDMAAFDRAPVVSTAPGVVEFAGVKSGYGYVVDIDHGHGFKTRYAHLHDIQVNRGERVAIGQRVGSMGSTGRSTGTHLHYEVWFRGKQYDPIAFLKAGQHVHEQG